VVADVYDLGTLPDDFLVLDHAGGPSVPGEAVWSCGSLRLWRARAHEWALLSRIDNPNGVEAPCGGEFFWLGGGETTLHVIAARSGVARLTLELEPGPSIPDRPTRTLAVRADRAHGESETEPAEPQRIVTAAEGSLILRCPVVAGRNRIVLAPLDEPPPGFVLANGDRRALVVKVRSLRVELEPASVTSDQ
jgi:hypothetical protein